jgi:hypothetical protein
MNTYLPFDLRIPFGIQFLFLGILAGTLPLSSCDKSKEKEELQVEVVPPPEEEPAALQDAGSEPAAEPEVVEGVFGEGENAVLRATGICPKGRDISLARQVAAQRARRNLLKLMKEKGYSAETPGILRESVIERFYFRGKFVHAVSAIPLSKVTGSLNESEKTPSNTPEDNQQEKN